MWTYVLLWAASLVAASNGAADDANRMTLHTYVLDGRLTRTSLYVH